MITVFTIDRQAQLRLNRPEPAWLTEMWQPDLLGIGGRNRSERVADLVQPPSRNRENSEAV